MCRAASTEYHRAYKARRPATAKKAEQEAQNARIRLTRAGGRGLEAQLKLAEKDAKHHAYRFSRGRAYIDLQKASPCVDCGGTFPPECMDFDHRPGEAKTKNVGLMVQASTAAIDAEIAKCDLVCSNCHRIRSRARKGNPFARNK